MSSIEAQKAADKAFGELFDELEREEERNRRKQKPRGRKEEEEHLPLADDSEDSMATEEEGQDAEDESEEGANDAPQQSHLQRRRKVEIPPSKLLYFHLASDVWPELSQEDVELLCTDEGAEVVQTKLLGTPPNKSVRNNCLETHLVQKQTSPDTPPRHGK